VTVKVSVVVPVYNPGEHIEPCISSLQAQTMSPDEVELIFVDDGSTDGSGDRLDRLAADNQNVTVVHIPNSGWPGKPRNIGIGAATGEYVQFVDQDDSMGPEALARLYDSAVRNDSDIVIGKVVSDFRPIPHGLFSTNRDRCTLQDGPLIDSLTPHKMFRRSFLEEHRLRYAEGRRRLEDQLFMMQSYFPAKNVSVVSDYPCYFYRKRADGKNAGSERIDPRGYYGNLAEVLDVVDENTEPGDFRNRLLRRFYRGEMLGRLSEPGILRWDDDYLTELFDVVHDLADRRVPEGVRESMPSLQRVRSGLLRSGRLDRMVTFAERMQDLRADARLRSFAWKAGRARLSVRVRHTVGGVPFELVERDGLRVLDDRLTEGLAQPPDTDVAGEPEGVRVDLALRERTTSVEWLVPTRLRPRLTGPGAVDGEQRFRLEVAGTVPLDPLTAAAGVPVGPGEWDVWVRLRAFGITKSTRLGAQDQRPEGRLRAAVLGTGGQVVRPHWSTEGLTLRVGGPDAVSDVLSSGRLTPRVAGRTLSVSLPFHYDGLARFPGSRVVLQRHGQPPVRLPAELSTSRPPTHVTVPEEVLLADGRRGTWRLSVGLDGDDGPAAAAGTVRLGRRSVSAAAVGEPLPARVSPRRAAGLARRAARAAVRRVRG
jgi:glycosyltransferase involved in cell wall biosynthesis